MNSIKEYNMGMDFTVKTFAGLEQALYDELKELGAKDLEIIKRGVTFRGDLAMMYKVNYLSRLAVRVLKPIGVFDVTDEKQLYDKVKKISWMEIFKVTQTFSVDSNVFYSNLDHSHYVSLKTKDAIVDQFREETGKRPWVSTDNPDIYIDVHISHNVCTISLDSSGESLHKRGYRIATDKAPINEVLAAGMINFSGWDGKVDLYDPMCGSGTISTEAAMLAMNIPAGYYRQNFAFMKWEQFDEELWESIRSDADSQMKELECEIYASDRSDKAVGIAKRNFRNAGLHKDINIQQAYFDSVEPAGKKGVIIMNPPYGMRLEERGELRDLYRGIGDVLKNTFIGFEAWIISPNFETMKFIGLKPSKRITLYNGPVETRLMKFEVYEGTRRYGDNKGSDFNKDRNKDYYKKDRDSYKKEGGYKPKFSERKSYDRYEDKDRKRRYDSREDSEDQVDDRRSDNKLKELEKRSQNFEKHLESIRRFSKPSDQKKRRKRINKKPPKED